MVITYMQVMDKEIAETEDALVQLRAKEGELEVRIRKVTLGHLYNERSNCNVPPDCSIELYCILYSVIALSFLHVGFDVEKLQTC